MNAIKAHTSKLALFLAILLVMAVGNAALAATLTVTNSDASGFGSLRHRLGQANANLDHTRIEFANSLGGKKISTDGVSFEVNAPITIDGNTTSGRITLDGGGNDEVVRLSTSNATLTGLNINNSGSEALVAIVQEDSDVSLSNISLSNGRFGIENDAFVLTVTDCEISNTEIPIVHYRGYGQASALVNVSHCYMHDNDAAIHTDLNAGPMQVSNSAFVQNGDPSSPIALFSLRSDVEITNVTISDNFTPQVFNLFGVLATLELTNTTVVENSNPAGASHVVVAGSNSTVTFINSVVQADDTDCLFDSGATSVGSTKSMDTDGSCGGPGITSHTLEEFALHELSGTSWGKLRLPTYSSVLIDAADNALCPSADQRTSARPLDGNLDGNADCDIGAAERMIPGLDFGDADSSIYPTLLAQNGARHMVDGTAHVIYLGNAEPDAEADASTNQYATGDDSNGDADEDGISLGVLTNLALGRNVALDLNIDANMGHPSGASIYLDAWVDFNRDGDWQDANEQVAASQVITPGGANSLQFSVPNNASIGRTSLRLRISSAGGLSPTGLARDGEVEDYSTMIVSPTVGDGTPASCDEAALLAVLDAGDGSVDFDCGSAPHEFLLSSAPSVSHNVDILGGGDISFRGYGLYVTADTFSMSGVKIRDAAGAGIALFGNTAELIDVEIFGGQNTAVAVNSSSTLNMHRSSIHDNQSESVAAGIFVGTGSTLNLSNSTVADNTAFAGGQPYGAGVQVNGGTANVYNSTISNNHSNNPNTGALYLRGGSINVYNSIIADNSDDCEDETGGGMSFMASSLDSDGSCAALGGAISTSNNLRLDGPAYFNSSTEIVRIQPGSDAVDAGDAATCAAAPVNGEDQRAIARLRDGDGDGTAVCDIGAYELAFDFGDAPTSYATRHVDDGARHVADTSLLLGVDRQIDLDGVPSFATSDGAEEDGVSFGEIQAGQNATVNVTVSAAGLLDAWMDFNRDGDWDDAGEQIFTNEPMSVGLNGLTYSVPASAAHGDTYARFRLSSAGGLASTGVALDGEVEDFQVSQTNATDTDGDGHPDHSDNCPNVSNATQTNTDGDSEGDACDADDDNDGMSDAYENANGLNPLVDDADLDADLDGFSNKEEHDAGTDPQDGNDVPQVVGPLLGLPGDLNGNGHVDVCVMLNKNCQFRDGDTGNDLFNPGFSQAHEERFVVAMPDRDAGDADGNATPDLASVGYDSNANSWRLQIRDIATGQPVANMGLPAGFDYVDMALLDDSDGSQTQGLVVWSVRPSDGLIRVLVKGRNGSTLGDIRFGTRFDLVDTGVLDAGVNSQVVLLGRDPNTDAKIAVARDLSGNVQEYMVYPRSRTVHKLLIIPNIDGAGDVGYAVTTEDNSGLIRVMTRLASTNNYRLPHVSFDSTHKVVDLALIDGNASVPVIGMLQTAGGDERIWLRNLNNQNHSRWNMSPSFDWKQLHGAQDLDGAGTAGMVAVGTKLTDGQIRVETRASLGAVGLRSDFGNGGVN